MEGDVMYAELRLPPAPGKGTLLSILLARSTPTLPYCSPLLQILLPHSHTANSLLVEPRGCTLLQPAAWHSARRHLLCCLPCAMFSFHVNILSSFGDRA